MASLPELEDALRNADAAGDTAAAQQLADEIVRMRGSGAEQQQPAPVQAAQPLPHPGQNAMPPVNQGVDAPLRVLQQGNRGLADAVGAPVDMVSMGLNAGAFGVDKIAELFGGNFDARIEKPVLGSDWIADKVSGAYEAVGGNIVPEEAVSPGVDIAAQGARGAAAALPVAFGLASAPVQASGKLPALAKPYGSEAGATLTRDAVAGAGAGVGQAGYDEFAPQEIQDSFAGPFLKALSSIIGGVGAAGLESVAEGSVKGLANAGRNVAVGAGDPSAPVNSATGKPFTRTEMDQAAQVAQAMPSQRGQAVANIEEGARDFAQFATPAETPTVGMLSDDIGMAVQENVLRARNGQRFAERDAARRGAASRQVDQTAPAGADGRNFTNEATRQYDETLNTARSTVDDAAAREAAARTDLQRQNADLEGFRAGQPQVSRAMAEDFDAERQAARQQKNDLYDAADPKAPVDGRFLDEAVSRIDKEMPDAERMNPGPYAEIAGRVRRLTSETISGDEAASAIDPTRLRQNPDGTVTIVKDITWGDLKALRAQVSEARKAAVTASGQSVAGSGADVQRLDQLNKVLGKLADEINPEAAKNYREEYAPRFKEGRAGEYGAAVDRATRTGGESSATRPSEFGDKFLRKPEDAASLLRATPGGRTEQNARGWMLGDLAKSGVLTDNAEIRFDKFKQWADKNRETISQFPELAETVDQELSRAQRGGALSKQLAQEVADARAGLKTTETELRRSALQSAIGNNPENAVASIMGSGDPETRMAEMVQKLSGNKDATNGLKAAVRDWVKDKAGTTAGIVGDPDATRLSRANLEKLFNKHEKTLAKIYSPDEMNALRQAHKLMSAEAKLDIKTTAGSNTFDKVMAAQKTDVDQRKRMLEAALKAKYGVLKGGGVFRTINLFLSALPDGNKGLEDLLFEVQFNPDLAKHLLTRPVKDVNSPAWNSRLNTLMGVVAGARESTEGKKRKPLEITMTEPANKSSLANDVEK